MVAGMYLDRAAGVDDELGVLVLEVSFRLAGALVDPDRGLDSLTRAHEVVLCVGDSRNQCGELTKHLGSRCERNVEHA